MAKTTIKRALGVHGDPSLVDTDRITPKAEGGTYEEGNVRVLSAREHMARHGTLREREEGLAQLKATFDDRVQTMKLRLKINNQLLAYQRRTDDRRETTEQFLQDELGRVEDRLSAIEKALKQQVKQYAKADPVTAVLLRVRGVGPITAAGLAVYVDFEKAPTVSSLWAYVGLDKPSHERYTKTKASGGNKILRTVLYTTAESMMKDRQSPYRLVYERVKGRLAESHKVTKSRTTQGNLVEIAWKDTKPGHRHGAAMRAIIKHFLADYWFVGRELLGLPTRPLYAEEYLGHTGIVRPEERGWKW